MKKFITIFSLALLLLLSATLNCYASTTYPSIMSVIDKEYYAYTIYTLYNGEISARVVSSDNESVINGVLFSVGKDPGNDGKFAITAVGGAITVNQYILRNGAWVKTSSTNINNNGYSFFEDVNNSVHKATFYESTKDIKINNTSTIFFPLTLPEAGLLEATLEMITVEIPGVGTKVVAQMRTILLCGVGCLALLIGLFLLPKMFRRWVA